MRVSVIGMNGLGLARQHRKTHCNDAIAIAMHGMPDAGANNKYVDSWYRFDVYFFVMRSQNGGKKYASTQKIKIIKKCILKLNY